MFRELVFKPDDQHRLDEAHVLQGLQHSSACTAFAGTVFHRDQAVVREGHVFQHSQIQGFGPAHVDHRSVQGLGRLQSFVKQGAERQNSHAFSLPLHFCLSPWQRGQVGVNGRAHTGTSGVAHRDRVVQCVSRAEQLSAFFFIGRASHAHVGNAAGEGDVVHARMGGAVGAHQTGAVQGKDNGQFLQSHIVDQLVISALQKRRVNGHHGFEAFTGQARSKRHGVLLCNADVVVTTGKAFTEGHHARAFSHGGRDGHQAWVFVCHVAQPLAKHLGERDWGLARTAQAHRRIKFARAVVGHRVQLGLGITLAFARDHMQKLGAGGLVQFLQGIDQALDIMAIDRPGVGESQFFKNRMRLNQVLGLFLQVLGQCKQRRCIAQHLLTQFFGLGIKAPAHQLSQVMVQGAHRRADRHVVVVQNDQQVIGAVARVVHRLVGHACGQGPIANDGHRFALAAGLLVRHRHAQCGRNTG